MFTRRDVFAFAAGAAALWGAHEGHTAYRSLASEVDRQGYQIDRLSAAANASSLPPLVPAPLSSAVDPTEEADLRRWSRRGPDDRPYEPGDTSAVTRRDSFDRQPSQGKRSDLP
jgi:hypothetical protein